MVAAIIRDSIRSKPYQMDEYPNMIYLGPESVRKDIPSQLDRFLSGVIKTKSNDTQSELHRRKAGISHSMIYACIPRSFISSIILSLSIYVYKKFESRVLVTILCSLGYGVSYDEVKLFLDNILAAPSYVEQFKNLGEEAFTHFIFDNADWNKQNDTGQDSWHIMGGIAAVSPSHIIEDKYTIKRCKTSTPFAGNQFIRSYRDEKLVTSSCSSTIDMFVS